jgi:accessory colonization factor AcfC
VIVVAIAPLKTLRRLEDMIRQTTARALVVNRDHVSSNAFEENAWTGCTSMVKNVDAVYTTRKEIELWLKNENPRARNPR